MTMLRIELGNSIIEWQRDWLWHSIKYKLNKISISKRVAVLIKYKEAWNFVYVCGKTGDLFCNYYAYIINDQGDIPLH